MKLQNAVLAPIVYLVVASTTSIADTAVSQTNVQVQASYGRTDIDFFGYSDSLDSYAGQMALQVPIGSVLGASLQAVAGNGEFIVDDDYDYYLYMASLFARLPKLGMLGIGVGGTEIKVGPFGDSSNTDYQAIAAGYLGPVTLALTRVYSENKDTPDSYNSSWSEITWYIVPNFLINASAGFMDAKDTYMVSLEHQIGNSGFSYGLSYGWYNDSAFDTKDYYIVVAYRFGKSKSLQERYRHDLYSTR